MHINFIHKDEGVFIDNRMPILVYSGSIESNPNWGYTAHSHDEFSELTYVRSGEGIITVDGKEYTAKKGDIYIFNRSVLHEERSNPNNPIMTYYCAIANVSIKGCEKNCLIRSDQGPLLNSGSYGDKIESFLSDILLECKLQQKGFTLLIQGLVLSLVALIQRIYEERSIIGERADDLAETVKDYIDKNYSDRISLSSIANTLYVSPYYMSHVFKSKTGNSPINYLIMRRIEEAKILLCTTDKTLLEVSELVGYDNVSYFNTQFKKVTGISPGKFKRNNTDKRR